MSKKKVFITRVFDEKGIKLLRSKGFEVKIAQQNGPISKKELIQGVKWCDYLVPLLTDKIDKEIIDSAPQLLGISNYAVGYDNIDIKYASQNSILVANAAVANVSESVADFTVGLLFSTARRISESDRFTRAGKYKGWNPNIFLGQDISYKTVGLIGMGAIGKMVAERLTGFHVRILYNDYFGPDKAVDEKYRARHVSLSTLLKQSDFVSLHVPLNKSTYHLISDKELKLMKKTAILINTARGPVVDEKALTRALIKKNIAGAALDVFEAEPSIDVDPKDNLDLKKLDNIVLTSHIASASTETRQAMSEMIAKNIIAFVQNKKPQNIINPEIWGKQRK